MPEMPKWLIALIVVVVGGWIISQTADFVGKVNTTVNKANSSMNQTQQSVSSIGKYEE